MKEVDNREKTDQETFTKVLMNTTIWTTLITTKS
jgi:hypothetical protein